MVDIPQPHKIYVCLCEMVCMGSFLHIQLPKQLIIVDMETSMSFITKGMPFKQPPCNL
jgi:hypothetical protein